MNRILNRLFPAAMVASILFFSCKKENDYPVTPVITFKDFIKLRDINNADSLQLTVSFTDGDGDIGNSGDGLSKWYFKYFEKANGVFTEINLGIPPFGIPFVPVAGRNKNISGEISVSLVSNPFKVNDTIRYEIYITDRAGHQSNSITTPELITNQQ